MRLESREVLKRLGYSFIEWIEGPQEPETSDKTFGEILDEANALAIGRLRLYRHQFEALEALREGRNVILISGTGSGKTEAWVFHALSMVKNNNDYRVLALYPTLALANDQIGRIERYASVLSAGVAQIDSVKKEEYARTGRLGTLRGEISAANFVISNPAFVLHDLKKYLLNKASSLLAKVFEGLNLLVIDEVDFYGPRSLALLLGMIEILAKVSNRPLQVAVLTATLSNPEALGEFLRAVTGRDYSVVRGRPFSVENRSYLILGKDLRSFWEIVRERFEENARNVPTDHVKELEALLSSFESFSKNVYRVLAMMEALGIDVPSPSIDVAEIVAEYAKDEAVTVVFTRSIAMAEELAKGLAERGLEGVASHHYLVSKAKRKEIEERMKRGDLKVVISPKTLSHGIDVGNVARVVHVGLPDEVSEFYQREGRKGRRREIGFSETVMIPVGRWDRELLANGLEAFRKWLDMGIEKVLVSTNNLYKSLFTGICKIKSPWFKAELDARERRALEEVGVLRGGTLNARLLDWVFERMNFYEFAPPYGVKRYVLREGKRVPLEPIGHCTLVEKFQPGCIDISEDAIVVRLNTGRSSRHVGSVEEAPIRELDFRSYDFLFVAHEEYTYIKSMWNEKPSLLRDLLSGRISSEELCVVYVPTRGFGPYRKVPNRCIWTVRSQRPRISVVNGQFIVYYDKRPIYVPAPTGGEYRDYTYGYTFPVSPVEDAELLRLALATLMIILRRRYGIRLETIMYDVVKLGEDKYFSLHEPEAAGIIEEIDWLDVRNTVSTYSFDDLDRILLSGLDDIAYSTFVTIRFNWEIVRQEVLRAIDYVLAKERLRVFLRGREFAIPKPSPALKRISVSLLAHVVEEAEQPILVVGMAFFDGANEASAVEAYPPIPYIRPPARLLELERVLLDKVLYEEFMPVVAHLETLVNQAKLANLRGLVRVLEGEAARIYDLGRRIESLGLGSATPEDLVLESSLVTERVPYQEVQEALSRASRGLSEREREIIAKYLSWKCRAQYLASLLVDLLEGQQSHV
ncbi:MAG: DEAD/DEAH box helicase [Desulfurococcaceae archaeon]